MTHIRPSSVSADQPKGLSRRVFVASAAAGGLALGVRFSVRPAQAAAGDADAVGVELNAFVEIMPDNRVSIVVPGAEFGQGIYNALPKIVAEEMEADWSRVDVRLATANPAYGNPNMGGRQSTGGSQSVMGYYTPLRKVGAAAKAMLLEAAAKQLGVDVDELVAENSVITHAPSGRSATFGEVAAEAAKLTPPEEPALKDQSEFKLLGRSMPRKDTPAKVDGSAVFGADVKLPGKLFAALRTAPVFGGEAVSDNRAEILARPGIVAVTEVDHGLAVIAETFWQAKTAADSLDVEWDTKGYETFNSKDLWAEMHASLDSEAKAFPGAKGNVIEAMAGAAKVFEADYEVPFLAHACMEPMTSTALVTDEECHMWSPHQQQDGARAQGAEISGLPLEKVHLENTFIGGGFGRKWELDFARQSVQAAMAVKGRPVTLIWTREQDIRYDYYRGAYAARMRAGLDENGNLIAMQARLAGESVLSFQGRSRDIPDPIAVGGSVNGTYDIPNTLIEFVEHEPYVPVGFWRSVAASQNGFFSESALDEAAHLAGKDPYQFRRALLTDKPRELAVLDKAAEMAGWGRELPAGRGLGIGFFPGFGSINAQVVEVEVSGGELKVHKIWCAYDCGFALNPDNVKYQMESGIVYGLTAALFGEITIENGAVVQSNFHDYEMLRMANMPEIEVELIESGESVGGAGEASVPAVAPAVANAIFAATGQRIRRLPLRTSGYGVA